VHIIQLVVLLITIIFFREDNICIYFNENDNFQLALMVQGECSLCPEEEQLAIANVAKNRMVLWQKSMQEILDPGQFQGLCNPINEYTIPYNIADSVLSCGVADSSLFFYKKDMNASKWSKTLTILKVYKFHNICY